MFKRLREIEDTVSSEQYKFAITRCKIFLVAILCGFIPLTLYYLIVDWRFVFVPLIPLIILIVLCRKTIQYCEKRYQIALQREREAQWKKEALEKKAQVLQKEKEELEKQVEALQSEKEELEKEKK